MLLFYLFCNNCLIASLFLHGVRSHFEPQPLPVWRRVIFEPGTKMYERWNAPELIKLRVLQFKVGEILFGDMQDFAKFREQIKHPPASCDNNFIEISAHLSSGDSDLM